MPTKTLIIAAAAVLGLGVGSAFAHCNGYERSPTSATTTGLRMRHGQSAGDTVQQAQHHVPRWIKYANTSIGG